MGAKIDFGMFGGIRSAEYVTHDEFRREGSEWIGMCNDVTGNVVLLLGAYSDAYGYMGNEEKLYKLYSEGEEWIDLKSGGGYSIFCDKSTGDTWVKLYIGESDYTVYDSPDIVQLPVAEAKYKCECDRERIAEYLADVVGEMMQCE